MSAVWTQTCLDDLAHADGVLPACGRDWLLRALERPPLPLSHRARERTRGATLQDLWV